MAISQKQRHRLVTILGHFITASRKAYPNAYMGNKDGGAWTYEEYADDTLRLFGIQKDECRFVLTKKEQREHDARHAEARKEQRRLDAKKRRFRKALDKQLAAISADINDRTRNDDARPRKSVSK